MRLSQKQLAQYREQGFAGPNPILSNEQLERLRGEMDTLIEALPPGQRPEYMPSPRRTGGDSRRVAHGPVLSEPGEPARNGGILELG